jgi:hypothetical protein
MGPGSLIKKITGARGQIREGDIGDFKTPPLPASDQIATLARPLEAEKRRKTQLILLIVTAFEITLAEGQLLAVLVSR